MKKENIKITVGAGPVSAHASKARQNKGITLIALIITIIVMLILVSVTINMAINGGLFEKAGEAVGKTENAINKEQELASGKITIGDITYNSIDEYINNLEDIKLVNVRDDYEHHAGYINYLGNILNEANSVYIRVPVEEGDTWFVWFDEPNRLSSCELRYENSSYEKVSYLNMKNQPKYHFNKESSKYGAVMEIPSDVSYMCVTLKFVDYWDCTNSAIIAKVNKKFESTWVNFGDSLTAFNNTALRNWLHLSSEKLAANYFNLAKSGTGYSYNGGFSQKFSEIPPNTHFDLVTFFGSFNDLSSSAVVGSATDVYVEGGNNSLAACMNYSYDYIITNYPDVKIAVVAPTPWSSTNPEDTTSKASQYVAVMQEICELKGIPFLDLFHNSGMTPWEADYNNKYFSNADGTHPNDEGHKIFAPKIIAFLQSVLND